MLTKNENKNKKLKTLHYLSDIPRTTVHYLTEPRNLMHSNRCRPILVRERMESQNHGTEVQLELPLFQQVSNRIPKVPCIQLIKITLGEQEPVPSSIQGPLIILDIPYLKKHIFYLLTCQDFMLTMTKEKILAQKETPYIGKKYFYLFFIFSISFL